MKTSLKTTLLLAAAALCVTFSAQAQVTFWDGSESSTFTILNNWGGPTPPTTLNGIGLQQDANGVNAPVHSSGSVAATSYVFGASATFGSNQTTSLTLNGGSLSTTGDFEVATSRENHHATVDISNGSVLSVGANLDNINTTATVPSTFTLNVLSGGTIEGVNNFRGDVDINVTGGAFHVGSNTASGSTTTFSGSGSWLNNDSDFVLSGTGTAVFDIYSTVSYDQFFSNAGPSTYTYSLDLSGGTVVLALDSAYSPTVGDSFEVVDFVSYTYFSGSTGNIANSLITGGANAGQFVQWDTTNWVSSGTLSVASIIPEPSSALLIGLSAGLLLLRRRR